MMKKECIFCKITSNKNDYCGTLKDFAYWRIIVSREQHTLSTLVIILKRHIVRFSSITKEELLELNHIQKILEEAIDQLFKPQLYNYLQCGNAVDHLHLHLIPRYKKNVKYGKKTFTDKRYGDSVKETSEIEETKIIEKLKKDLLNKIK